MQGDPAPADTFPTMRVIKIQQQIGSGEYRVDTYAVAEAILRRLCAGEGLGIADDGPARAS